MKGFIFLCSLALCAVVSAKTYYVAPTGGNDLYPGTISQPWATWRKAFATADAGDTVYFRGGIYYATAHPNPNQSAIVPLKPLQGIGHSGTQENPICFFAYPSDYAAGNIPILDGINVIPNTNYNNGIEIHYAEYIYLKGLTVRNFFQFTGGIAQGISTLGANMTFENCISHDIGGRGFYCNSAAWNDFDNNGVAGMYAYDTTRFINCDAYNIVDSLSVNPGNAGDGWKCENYQFNYWTWEGCRAWNYSDDGFDPSGTGYRLFTNCWAMGSNKYAKFDIEGNGFKVVASDIRVEDPRYASYGDTIFFPELLSDPHLTKYINCLAIFCTGTGFYNNIIIGSESSITPGTRGNLGNNALVYNNTSYYNQDGFLDGTAYGDIMCRSVYKNNIAIGNDRYEAGIYRPSIYIESHNNWDATQLTGNPSWPGWVYSDTVTVTAADFVTTDSLTLVYLFTAARQPDGSLPVNRPLMLASISDLVDAGTNVGLSYSGKASDIGYSEYLSGSVSVANPVYLSAVIENVTPAKLEMTYSLTLANILTPASAFTVKVNTVTRSVSSVSISGTKVLLTLASPVVYGDKVTVAYTKPASNPLQTAAGGQAASVTAQNVTNNCIAPTVNQSPAVNISSPTKSTTFISPATITIDAVASDPDGTVAKVDFYNGTVKLGERTVAPYSYTWKEVTDGTYSITAVATDNQNARTASPAVSVVVEKAAVVINQLPVVNITSPSKNKKYRKNEKIVIEVEASDPDGIVSKVEFKNGNAALAELTSAPYIYIWEDVDTGTYVITAIATDNLGAINISSEMKLKVENFYDVNSEILNLYPNPNNGHFSIDLYPSLLRENNRVSVISLAGKAVYSEMITEEEISREFDLSDSAAGTYVLIVTSGNIIVTTKKFVKK